MTMTIGAVSGSASGGTYVQTGNAGPAQPSKVNSPTPPDKACSAPVGAMPVSSLRLAGGRSQAVETSTNSAMTAHWIGERLIRRLLFWPLLCESFGFYTI